MIRATMEMLMAATPRGGGGFDLVVELAVIMCVAAGTTLLFQRLRQPVVLGYLLAGLIVGRHLPVPLFADEQAAHTLSELGVILLMFSLGLEFSLRKLIKVGPTAGLVAVIQCSLLLWLGYVVARAFGWTGSEGLFTGAMIAISSTTIIVKAFAEQQVTGRITELVFGILIVEDLIAILLLAVLTAVATGAGLSAGGLALTVAKLGGFLVGMLAIGMLVVPRTVRAVVRLGRNETTIVASVGICFGCALLARSFGYSVALGAFLGGALVAESGEAKTIEHLVEPLRDVFAAIFCVSVGMLIDPALVAQHWAAVLVLTAVVVVGKLAGVTIGAFLAGNGVATSVRAGMSLAQIGEFSFIIAGVGLSLGVIRGFLYPVAVAVSALTTLTTPWLIRAARPVASYIDRRLPKGLQTYAALYGAWVARLAPVGGPRRTGRAQLRRWALFLLVDVAAIAAVIIAASYGMPTVTRGAARLNWVPSPRVAQLAVIALAVVLVAPFALGAIRVTRGLATKLALEALPATGAVDLSAAPRRALVVSIQIGILLVVGIPLMAVTQPFLPSLSGLALLLAALVLLLFPLWQSAANLEEHVRAGAQVVLERLAAESHVASSGGPAATTSSGNGTDRAVVTSAEVAAAGRVMAGIGAATPARVAVHWPAVGRTLKQLQLRGRTSATVVAIDRGAAGVIYPTGDEVIAAADVLVLTGSEEAVQAALAVLRDGEGLAPREPAARST